jgi:hypothetical protein
LIDGAERLRVHGEVQGADAIATIGVDERIDVRAADAVTQEGIGLTNGLIDGTERYRIDK